LGNSIYTKPKPSSYSRIFVVKKLGKKTKQLNDKNYIPD